MKKIEVKKGDKYNNLVILRESCKHGNQRMFECKCSCGNIKEIQLGNLRNGITKNCGCNIGANLRTHGFTGKRIHRIWSQMKQRCDNKNHKRYLDYGGRGITYDEKWKKFEGFYEDMKEGYEEHLTIDREENDGNYCKSNCKWSTYKEQARNRRNSIKYKGKTVSEWSEILGISDKLIYSRLKYGWTFKKALEIL